MTPYVRMLLRRAITLVVCLCLATLGAWRVLDARVAERCERWVEGGRADLARGEALAALDALGRALREPRCGVDAEPGLWRDYADARIRVRAPELGHVSEAVRALQRARSLDPNDPRIGTALAEAWLGIGLHDEAAAEAERVLARSAHAPARRVLASALLAAGRRRELATLLDDEAVLAEDFWFRATSLLANLSTDASRARSSARVLALEADARARRVLAVLANEAGAPTPEALVTALTAADARPSPAVLGTAALLLESRERPALAVALLSAHAARLDAPLRARLVALAWQGGRPELVAAALTANPVSVHEHPELVVYGALAGHEASLVTVRARPERDTAIARAWRALALAMLDGASPRALADASTAVLRDAPGSALALTVAAEAWLRLGEPARAEALTARAIRAEPFWAQPRFLRGVVRAARATPSQAPGPEVVADEVCRAAGLDAAGRLACAGGALPESSAPWQVLRVAIADARRFGEYALAETLVADLEAVSAERATLWRLEAARTRLGGDRGEEADAAAALRLREVLDVMPRHAEAELLMGLARARLGDAVGGRGAVFRAVTLQPALWRDGLRIALRMHREMASPDGAALIELTGRLIALAPVGADERGRIEETFLRGLVSRADSIRDAGLERAAYERLVRLAPELDFALNNLAWLLYEAREGLPTALDLAERALALRPDEPAYADTLATVRAWQAQDRAADAAERSRVEAGLEAERARIRARMVSGRPAQAR